MRVLITGGAGYIGSVATAKLLQEGHYIRIIDTLLFGGESLIGVYGHPRFEFLRGDIRESALIASALDGVEAVVHFAAIVGDQACSLAPSTAWEVNYEATCTLVNLSQEKGVQLFILVSTCSNYGVSDTGRFATEDSPLNPVSVYAETKVRAERYVLNAANSLFHPCVLRLSTVFGLSPRMRFDLLVNEFTRDAVLRKKLIVYGSRLWRPYIHVNDVAGAMATCLEAPTNLISKQVFNAGADCHNY